MLHEKYSCSIFYAYIDPSAAGLADHDSGHCNRYVCTGGSESEQFYGDRE